MIFDSIVIGGGVAGLFSSYNLSKNSKTLLIEKSKIGSGGSGSAGAFLNPKISDSSLSKLINSAMIFSRDFYFSNVPQYIHESKLIHIENGEKFILNSHVADAQNILNYFAKNINIVYLNIKNIYFDGEFWQVENFKTKNLILSTGAISDISKLTNEPYIKIRPVWGERLDIESQTILTESYHKDISISKTINGIIRIGATHFRDILERESSNIEQENFLKKALKIVNLENPKIIKSYSGVRSASHDYFPIVGKVVDSKKTVEKFPQIINGRKYNKDNYIYKNDLYIFSGLGGYGFSLAPYFGKLLAESILNNSFLDDEVEPHRLFSKYIKKSENRI